MRCKSCDYRLWNLRSRVCPECGTPFQLSDYEFVINAVQFRCPHCEQDYYGTDAKGHLVPIEFNCVRCQQPIHMNEMILLPAGGVEEEQTGIALAPWLTRSKHGFIKSWLRMIWQSMITPGQLIHSVPPSSSVGQAWWFALFTNTMAIALGWGPFIFLIAIVSMTTGPGTAVRTPVFGPVAGGMAMLILGWSIFAGVFIAVWGAVCHALLRITGQTQTTIGRTYQSLCYSSGANAIAGIPCLGYLFGWLWWLISAVVMIKNGQKVRTARALLAVLTLPALALAGGASLYVYAMSTAISMASKNPPKYTPATDAQAISSAIMDYAADHRYQPPVHPIQLVQEEYITIEQLFVTGTPIQNIQQYPIDNTTLGQLMDLPKEQREQIVQSMVSSVPHDVAALRFGDYVFTHYGLNLQYPPDQVWVAVQVPNSVLNNPNPTAVSIDACDAKGTCIVSPVTQLGSDIKHQNQRRSTLNQPLLPELTNPSQWP